MELTLHLLDQKEKHLTSYQKFNKFNQRNQQNPHKMNFKENYQSSTNYTITKNKKIVNKTN